MKPQELRAIEQQVEELRILNTKLNAQIKKISLAKNKPFSELPLQIKNNSPAGINKGSSPAAPTQNI